VSSIYSITGWVTDSRQTVDMGSIPSDMYLLRGHVHVLEAFNSNANDTLTVGTDADSDSVITSIDVSSTGIKSVTLGVRAGYSDAASQVKAFYVNSGSEPSTGKALIILEFIPTSPLPT